MPPWSRSWKICCPALNVDLVHELGDGARARCRPSGRTAGCPSKTRHWLAWPHASLDLTFPARACLSHRDGDGTQADGGQLERARRRAAGGALSRRRARGLRRARRAAISGRSTGSPIATWATTPTPRTWRSARWCRPSSRCGRCARRDRFAPGSTVWPPTWRSTSSRDRKPAAQLDEELAADSGARAAPRGRDRSCGCAPRWRSCRRSSGSSSSCACSRSCRFAPWPRSPSAAKTRRKVNFHYALKKLRVLMNEENEP